MQLSSSPFENIDVCKLSNLVGRQMEETLRNKLPEGEVLDFNDSFVWFGDKNEGRVIKCCREGSSEKNNRQSIIRLNREIAVLQKLDQLGLADVTQKLTNNEFMPMSLSSQFEMELPPSIPFRDFKGDRRQAISMLIDFLPQMQNIHHGAITHNAINCDNLRVVEGPRGPMLQLHNFSSATVSNWRTPAKIHLEGHDQVSLNSIAPEVPLLGVQPSAATDVFSLGAVLYEVLNGRNFLEVSCASLMSEDNFDAARLAYFQGHEKLQMVCSLPPRIHRVLDRALNRVAKDRFGSAIEMHYALMAALVQDEYEINLQSNQLRSDVNKVLQSPGNYQMKPPQKKMDPYLTAKLDETVAEEDADWILRNLQNPKIKSETKTSMIMQGWISDNGIRKQVVVKAMKYRDCAGHREENQLLQRFNREVEIMTDQLKDKPFYPQVLHVISQSAYVMEYVDGMRMKEYISHCATDPRVTLSIFANLLTVLDQIHRLGIVHRDIQPENIVVTNQALIKLLDFGIAFRDDRWGHITNPNMLIAACKYLSPEQMMASEFRNDPRVDIYRCGLMLYETFAGATPVELLPEYDEEMKVREILELANRNKYRFPLKSNKVPDNVFPIVEKALKSDIRLRYPSAVEMRADVVRALDSLN